MKITVRGIEVELPETKVKAFLATVIAAKFVFDDVYGESGQDGNDVGEAVEAFIASEIPVDLRDDIRDAVLADPEDEGHIFDGD